MSDTARKEQKRQTWDSSYTVPAGSRSLPGLRKQALKTWLASTRVAIAQRLFYIYILFIFIETSSQKVKDACRASYTLISSFLALSVLRVSRQKHH